VRTHRHVRWPRIDRVIAVVRRDPDACCAEAFMPAQPSANWRKLRTLLARRCGQVDNDPRGVHLHGSTTPPHPRAKRAMGGGRSAAMSGIYSHGPPRWRWGGNPRTINRPYPHWQNGLLDTLGLSCAEMFRRMLVFTCVFGGLRAKWRHQEMVFHATQGMIGRARLPFPIQACLAEGPH